MSDGTMEMAGPEAQRGLIPPSGEAVQGSFLSDVIIEMGLAGSDDVEQALEHSRQAAKPFGEAALEKGILDETQLARAIAERHGLPYVDLDEFDVDHAAVELISRAAAERYRAVPIALSPDGSLLVALADPVDALAVNDIAVMTRSDIRPVVATPSAIAALTTTIPEHRSPLPFAEPAPIESEPEPVVAEPPPIEPEPAPEPVVAASPPVPPEPALAEPSAPEPEEAPVAEPEEEPVAEPEEEPVAEPEEEPVAEPEEEPVAEPEEEPVAEPPPLVEPPVDPVPEPPIAQDQQALGNGRATSRSARIERRIVTIVEDALDGLAESEVPALEAELDEARARIEELTTELEASRREEEERTTELEASRREEEERTERENALRAQLDAMRDGSTELKSSLAQLVSAATEAQAAADRVDALHRELDDQPQE